jgi:NADH-quinone oxidoreductase subunit K
VLGADHSVRGYVNSYGQRQSRVSGQNKAKERGMVPTNYYLILSAIIFAIGAVGVLTRRNALIIFMCVEMMLNSVNLTLIAFSRQWNNLNGQIFVFIVMAVAAAEVAVGLAVLISHFHHTKTANIDDINVLKW